MFCKCLSVSPQKMNWLQDLVMCWDLLLQAESMYVSHAVHRGAFCQFPFQWIYYCHGSKSTGKETDKTHLCAVSYLFQHNAKHSYIRGATGTKHTPGQAKTAIAWRCSAAAHLHPLMFHEKYTSKDFIRRSLIESGLS